MTAPPLWPDQDRLQRCSDRAWTPWVLVRWCGRHRLISAGMLALVALLLGAARAWADPGTGDLGGDSDVLISWMGIKDSHGVPVAKYTLTLNQGSWTDPTAKIFYYLVAITYEIYLCVTTTALWLIKFVLDFDWMRLFSEPFQTIGRGINAAMDRFGLAATAVAILAIIVVFTALADKTAKAFSHVAMGMLMIALAATIFANPLAQLVGPDGLLAKGRDTGLQIATSVSGGTLHSNGQKANPDDLVSGLADRFLRAPTQMLNFGVVSDSISRRCEQAWSKGILNNRGDKLKDDIRGCDPKKGESMHQKSMGNPASLLVPLNICGYLALFLVAFACYFVWHVVRSAVQAMLFAALAPPAFAIGVIPGGPQTFAWKTVLDCAMAFAAMIIYTAAFGGYNVVLDHVFAESKGNAIRAIFLTTLVLAFGFAFFGPLRRIFDRHRDNMAAKLGRGPVNRGSGHGWLSKVADVSRLKSDLLPGKGHGHASNGRPPGRVDGGESESASGSAAGGGGDAATPAVTVADNAGGDAGAGVSAGGQPGDGSSSSAASPDPQPTKPPPKPVVYLKGDDAAQAHDKLAEARRMQRGSRGVGPGPSGPPGGGGGGGRHALSEAA
ncbi:MAG: hypothetical protein JOZ49_01970 [Mycolicibacterium sp.]|nr:hypothetical protein [Mycolicibacterium sp.]